MLISMTSFPEVKISAARLDVREFGLDDAGLVDEVLTGGEPDALPPGAPSQPADVAEWLAAGVHRMRESGAGVHLMMVDRASGTIVGGISLFRADWEVRSVEAGYGVRGSQRGKGYATEALVALTAWALSEGGMQRVWLTANTDNIPSVRVAEKAGFSREGTLRRAGVEDDGLHDLALFSRLDDDRT
jgi:RimJ/RimL family protein N-acetyltransferase